MFDVGFSELFVIAVVALLVLGPERLPKAARFTGLWMRRIRAHWFAVRSELESELAAEELRRSLHQAREQLHEAQAQLREVVDHAVDAPATAVPDEATALPHAALAPEAADAAPPADPTFDATSDRPAAGP